MFVPASRSLRKHMYGPYCTGLRVSAGKIIAPAEETTPAVSRLIGYAHRREPPVAADLAGCGVLCQIRQPRAVPPGGQDRRRMAATAHAGAVPRHPGAGHRAAVPTATPTAVRTRRGCTCASVAAARCSTPPGSTTPCRAGPPLRTPLPGAPSSTPSTTATACTASKPFATPATPTSATFSPTAPHRAGCGTASTRRVCGG